MSCTLWSVAVMSSTKILVGTCCNCCVIIKWSGVSVQIWSKIFLHSTSGEYDRKRETSFVKSFSLWDPVTQSAIFWDDGKLLQDCMTKTSAHCLSSKQCEVWYFSLTALVTCLNGTSNTRLVTLTKLFTINSHVLFAPLLSCKCLLSIGTRIWRNYHYHRFYSCCFGIIHHDRIAMLLRRCVSASALLERYKVVGL